MEILAKKKKCTFRIYQNGILHVRVNWYTNISKLLVSGIRDFPTLKMFADVQLFARLSFES